jgi:hypothetical protein
MAGLICTFSSHNIPYSFLGIGSIAFEQLMSPMLCTWVFGGTLKIKGFPELSLEAMSSRATWGDIVRHLPLQFKKTKQKNNQAKNLNLKKCIWLVGIVRIVDSYDAD